MRKTRSLDSLLRPDASNDGLRARTIGTWTQIANEDLIDALGYADYDFTIIDCEHGAFGIETAERLIRACEAAGVAPLVRVPKGDTTSLYKALDSGAMGVLLPSIETKEELADCLSYSGFAPHGRRGACPIVRAAHHSALDWTSFAAEQSGRGVIAMIETERGVSNCESICAVEGLKAVLIGPFDLSVSMGYEGDHRHPNVLAAIDRVIATCNANAVPVVMPVFAAESAAMQAQISHWSAHGIRVFAVGADKILVTRAFADYARAARDA
jgi:4-hydroxy-2-oxoheptanedioate aldolase